MFERWYAIDPGANSIRILDKTKENIVSIRSCVAYKNGEIVAFSNDAFEYVYHRDSSIKVKYPIQEGKLISDAFPLIEDALNELGLPKRIYKPCLVICLPKRNKEVEDQWFNCLHTLGIKRFEFISVPELMNEKGVCFYIHAGHSYTLIGLSLNGKPIMEKKISFAGYQMDELISQMALKKTHCFISDEDARVLKEAASSNLFKNKNAKLSCFGMNKYRQYEKVEVSSMDVWSCIENIEKQIVLWTKQCLSSLSLETQEKVMEKGIYLSGGLANCFGLKQYLEYELHCPIICTNDGEYDIINKMKGWK